MHTQNGIGGRFTQSNVVGLSLLDESRLRALLRTTTPSEPWVDAQFVEVTALDRRSRPVVRRLHDASVFPPGGSKTGMIRCRICNVFNPPNAMEGGACLDHREDGNWPVSPSAASIEKAKFYGKERDLPLEPETEEALVVEIRKYPRNRRKRRS